MPSPARGDVVINEVLYDGSIRAFIERSDFIELRNATGSPVDVSGWRISDNNLIAGPEDTGGGFEYALPPSTVIPANDYAVIWMGHDRGAVDPGFTDVIGGGVIELYVGTWVNWLDEPGDDVTLYDDGYQIVDHVAWGPSTAPDRKTPMPAAVGVWDAQPNNEGNLQSVPRGTSISLTPNGVFTADSDCWEENESDTATCPGALPTTDVDSYPGRSTSVGRDNNSPVAPSARDDDYTTDEDVTLNESAVTGMLANDSDGNRDPLTVNTTAVIPPAGGTLTLHGDGSFDYDPGPAFNGVDTFVYEIDDGTGPTDTAMVTITVTPVPDAPEANADSYLTREATFLSVAAPGVLSNDGDRDGDPLTVVTTPVTTPVNGTLTLRADGSFDYTPDNGFKGNDGFTYEVDDGTGLSDVASVTIAVDDTLLRYGWYVGDSGSGPDALRPSGQPPAGERSARRCRRRRGPRLHAGRAREGGARGRRDRPGPSTSTGTWPRRRH